MANNKIGVSYLGAFLTKDSMDKLLKEFPPLYSKIYGDHITLKFAPNDQDIEAFLKHVALRDYKVDIIIYGWYMDKTRQAVKTNPIHIPWVVVNENQHITISTKEVEPETCKLINEWHFYAGREILSAALDVFPRSA